MTEPTVTEAINAAIVQAVTELPHDSEWLMALARALDAVTDRVVPSLTRAAALRATEESET